MKTIEEFLAELDSAVQVHLPSHTHEVFLHTAQSFKAYFHLRSNLLVSIRYNATNGRFDAALVYKEERIYGCDNLKEWHYHPFENPKLHIPCEEPSLDEILNTISQIIKRL